jgi:transposase
MLRLWLEKQGIQEVHACLEATGNYGEALAIYLHEAGHMVSIVNPARIKGFAQSVSGGEKGTRNGEGGFAGIGRLSGEFL